MKRLIVKFNSGNGAILCEKCYVIIKTGKDFTEEEWKAFRGEITMQTQYCNKCKIKKEKNEYKN